MSPIPGDLTFNRMALNYAFTLQIQQTPVKLRCLQIPPLHLSLIFTFNQPITVIQIPPTFNDSKIMWTIPNDLFRAILVPLSASISPFGGGRSYHREGHMLGFKGTRTGPLREKAGPVAAQMGSQMNDRRHAV